MRLQPLGAQLVRVGDNNPLVLCNVTHYNRFVIKSFSHKGLQGFHTSGSLKGIVPQHASKLRQILATLDIASSRDEVDLPTFHLHQLTGQYEGMLSARVSGNWRVIFAFDGNDVILVDYLDYH